MVKAEVKIIDPYRPELNKTYICYPTETHIISDGTTTYEFNFNFEFPAIPRMTNEKREAIENLKKLKSFHNGSYGTAIDTAIKDLEKHVDEFVTEFADKCKECGKIKEDLYEKGFEDGKRYIVEQMCALLEKEVQE